MDARGWALSGVSPLPANRGEFGDRCMKPEAARIPVKTGPRVASLDGCPCARVRNIDFTRSPCSGYPETSGDVSPSRRQTQALAAARLRP